MAKKTRAQKIAASTRTPITSSSDHHAERSIITESDSDKEIKKYFFLDLRKSLIIVALILGFEVLLYFL